MVLIKKTTWYESYQLGLPGFELRPQTTDAFGAMLSQQCRKCLYLTFSQYTYFSGFLLVIHILFEPVFSLNCPLRPLVTLFVSNIHHVTSHRHFLKSLGIFHTQENHVITNFPSLTLYNVTRMPYEICENIHWVAHASEETHVPWHVIHNHARTTLHLKMFFGI